MSRWLRLYDDTINDPKVLKLPEAMRWHWIAMLCVASKNEGALPALDDIAIQLRVTAAKATEIISMLVKGQLLDKTETGFAPHNWNGRQYKSDVSSERVKRFRNGKRNVSSAVSETPPETETETETETEAETKAQKKDSPLRVADDWPENFGDAFWQAYPRKTEKLAAMKKLATLRKSGIVTFADLMAGVKRYAAIQREPQYTKQPTTWLNAGCWTDEISAGATNGDRIGNTRTTGHDAILAVAARKAREIDRNDEMARAADATGFAFGNGADAGGSDRDRGAPQTDQRDHQRVESDDQRIRQGEIIPPDKDVAGVSGRW